MVTIDVLRAVHHPVRRRIIDYLSLEGPTQVGTLARALEGQVGSISHHLRMLERVELVERAPELATDGRTSWWRARPLSLSWSADDFADRPADHYLARTAEKLVVEHQLAKLLAWKRRGATASEVWRRAAYSTDSTASATAQELAALGDAVARTVREWKAGIDTDDGQQREHVFVFAHGFPSEP